MVDNCNNIILSGYDAVFKVDMNFVRFSGSGKLIFNMLQYV